MLATVTLPFPVAPLRKVKVNGFTVALKSPTLMVIGARWDFAGLPIVTFSVTM
jgi:hypothetical protein